MAWLRSVRQPARTGLGILGVVAVGALLFDMLLLSRGLVLSFGDLLGRQGFDVRVLATDATPLTGPPLEHVTALADALRALPEIEAVAVLSIADVEVPTGTPGAPFAVEDSDIEFIGADPRARPTWTLLQGSDLAEASAPTVSPLVVNRTLANDLHLSPGSSLPLRARCGAGDVAVPPRTFVVAGIAEFPFDDADARTVAGRLNDLRQLCGTESADSADMLLVKSASRAGPDAAAAAIRTRRPDVHVVTNDQIIERFSRVEFSYFQQISFVLSTLTLFFGFLLIAVLLTVSVNQRLAEIAALRAIGLSRMRVMIGVLCESAIVVGAGGVVAVPAGFALSVWLDRILRALPGIPAGVSFFVFEPRVLLLYAALLAGAAIAAAGYPMRIVGTLPIAATLRREAVS
jgi:ABC-type lipoprotein release transport system permease subunit